MIQLCVGTLLAFRPRSIKVSLPSRPLSTLDVIHVIRYPRPSTLFVLQVTKAVRRPGNEASATPLASFPHSTPQLFIAPLDTVVWGLRRLAPTTGSFVLDFHNDGKVKGCENEN